MRVTPRCSKRCGCSLPMVQNFRGQDAPDPFQAVYEYHGTQAALQLLRQVARLPHKPSPEPGQVRHCILKR